MDLAKTIKPIIKGKPGWSYKPFTDQTMAMIFVKASTRTRVSFETGWYALGGHSFVLGDEIGIGKREATKDISDPNTAAVAGAAAAQVAGALQ